MNRKIQQPDCAEDIAVLAAIALRDLAALVAVARCIREHGWGDAYARQLTDIALQHAETWAERFEEQVQLLEAAAKADAEKGGEHGA